MSNVLPSKVRYPPESIVEAQSTLSVGTGDTQIASYLVDPFYATVDDLHFDPDGPADVMIGTDGYAEKMKIRNNAVFPNWNKSIRSSILAQKTIELRARATGGFALANFYSRYNITVRRPYIIDKILMNLDLTAEEEDIAVNLLGDKSNPVDLYDRINIGVLPSKSCFNYTDLLGEDILTTFQNHIYPVTRTITPIASSDKSHGAPNVVGNFLNPPYQREVWVLLGVWADWPVLPSADDSFLTIDRDDDSDYMKLDVTALPRNQLVRCYIPFLDELRVYLESASGSDGVGIGVGFLYGCRPMTIIDHELWDIPYQSQVERNEAQKTIAQYGLKNMLKAGLVP
jgi:hypothetical protein